MEHKDSSKDNTEIEVFEDFELDVTEIIEPIKLEDTENASTDTLSLYFKNISNYTHLPQEKEYELGKKIQSGDKEALKELVLANLKFVVSLANKYKNSGIPLTDIINQGNIGLLEAAKRFDPEKNVKFITYAVWWIRQAIIQGITEQTGSVRLPIKQAHILYKINMAKERLTKELSHEPTFEDISKATGIDINDIDTVLRVSRNDLSLDAPIRNNEDITFLDNLEAVNNVETDIINKTLRNSIEDMISDLSDREIDIITKRYGLYGEKPQTLGEIGDELGISRERVRQLELKALDKLRKKALRKKLRDYLN